MKTIAAKKSIKKPVGKAETKTKKAAPRKTVKTSAPKPAKAAAKSVRPAKKTPLKKPVTAKKASPAVKKTGPEKKTSGAKKIPAKISALKKPDKTLRKPEGAKPPAPAGKSSQGKAGKIPARAAARPKVTEKKLKKSASTERSTKKITTRVPIAAAKKTAMKEKAPVPKKTDAARKMAKTEKKPPAAGVEKKPVKAVRATKKVAERKQKKAPAKTAAEKIVPSKPAVKAVKKISGPRPTGERQEKPSAQKEPVPAKSGAKAVEEQKTPAPKAPARRKPRPLVSKTGTTRETVAAKIPALKKETGIQRESGGKLSVAAKKTGKRGPAVSPAAAPERPKLRIFLPGKEAEEEYLRESIDTGLPEEYGENALIAMAVDPNTIFVDWEIVPAEIAGKEGELTLRFHDTTGIEFDGSNANAVTDIHIARRVGNGFFVISMPGRDVVVEAGIMGPGSAFHSVVRSDVVSFPFLLSFDDLGIVQKLLAAGIPVGY